MCNVGVAYYKAKDLPRAHRYLDQCVMTGGSLDRDFITNVKTVLAAVEDKLATGDYKPLNFIIQPQSATTTFDSGVHDESLVGSRQIWVPFGSYKVTIHAEGYVDRVLEIEATNRDRGEHSVKLEPATGERTTPPPAPVPETTPLPEVPTQPAPKRSLVAPIVASAATGAFGGLALGFYLSARSNAESASAATRNREPLSVYTSYANRADTRERIAWIVGGVAGVTAIAAGILWYRALQSPAPVEVTASPNGAGISFVGRW
jgi:hypothetical protein